MLTKSKADVLPSESFDNFVLCARNKSKNVRYSQDKKVSV